MTHFIKKSLPVLLLGMLAGFLNGLLGAGGGIPLVLGLSLLFGQKAADGRRFFTTALAVMLPLSLFSAYRYAKEISLTGAQLLAVMLPAMLGGAVGAGLLKRLSLGALKRIFAIVMVLSGIFLLF